MARVCSCRTHAVLHTQWRRGPPAQAKAPSPPWGCLRVPPLGQSSPALAQAALADCGPRGLGPQSPSGLCGGRDGEVRAPHAPQAQQQPGIRSRSSRPCLGGCQGLPVNPGIVPEGWLLPCPAYGLALRAHQLVTHVGTPRPGTQCCLAPRTLLPGTQELSPCFCSATCSVPGTCFPCSLLGGTQGCPSPAGLSRADLTHPAWWAPVPTP